MGEQLQSLQWSSTLRSWTLVKERPRLASSARSSSIRLLLVKLSISRVGHDLQNGYTRSSVGLDLQNEHTRSRSVRTYRMDTQGQVLATTYRMNTQDQGRSGPTEWIHKVKCWPRPTEWTHGQSRPGPTEWIHKGKCWPRPTE